MPDYPTGFACPLIDGYELNVQTALLRTGFEAGNGRNRQLWDYGPTGLRLAFVIEWADLFDWQKWVGENAYDYFTMKLVSEAGDMVDHSVRFVGDLEVRAYDIKHCRVSVDAELEVIIPVVPEPPFNDIPPVISYLDPATFQTTTGAWIGTPTPTFRFEWLRNYTIIPGATGQTYQPTQDGDYQVRVIAENSVAAVTHLSNVITHTMPKAPTNTVAPTIKTQGDQFVLDQPGQWDAEPAPTITYQWLRNGAAIPGETSLSYTPTQSGNYRIQEWATNSEGSANQGSNIISYTLTAPTNTALPSISQLANDDLECDPGTWDGFPVPTITYQWALDGTDISNGVSNQFSPSQPGDYTCTVTATNSQGSASRTTSAFNIPAPPGPPVMVSAPVLQRFSSTVEVVDDGTWTGTQPITFEYRFQYYDRGSWRLAKDFSSSNGASSRPQQMRAVVRATNSVGTTEVTTNIV